MTPRDSDDHDLDAGYDGTLFERLRLATAGLDYESEADNGFSTFQSCVCDWPPLDRDVISLTKRHKKDRVQEVPWADFFGPLQKSPDAARYAALDAIFHDKAPEPPRVYRVGEVNVTYCLVRKTGSVVVGLVVEAVET